MTTDVQADSPSTPGKATLASQGSVDAKQPSLEELVPAVTDAPKGEVTLGEKAGAFGPWRAHHVIDEIAKKIAEQVVRELNDAGSATPRVLVVEDRLLLPGDWTAHYVRSTLERMKDRLVKAGNELDKQKAPLDSAINRLEQEEKAAKQSTPPQGSPTGGRRRSIDQGATVSTTEPSSKSPEVPSGGLSAAVNLLGLLRTDYTITATAVSAAPSELSTLTAAHLARRPAVSDGRPVVTIEVEADAFTTTGPSPIADLLKDVLGLRDSIVLKLSEIQASLAPVQAELTAINTRTTSIEQAWATVIADKKDDSADTTLLRASLDTLAEQSTRREKAIGPAVAVVAYSQQVAIDVDTAVAALLQASGTGEASLYIAIRNERISEAVQVRSITHVLYVNLDAIAADAVTRRSILGTSGRIRFLSAGNASWLLLNTANGTIADGGQENLADVTTFSLQTGQAKFAAGGLKSSEVGTDPLDQLEIWAKAFVAVLAVVLFAFGALSVIALVRVAFGK